MSYCNLLARIKTPALPTTFLQAKWKQCARIQCVRGRGGMADSEGHFGAKKVLEMAPFSDFQGLIS
jgi:hypothetical protein